MKTSRNNMTIPTNNIVRILLGTTLILLIPLVLTLLGSGVDGDGWHWTLSDFIIMGILIFLTGLALDAAMKKAGKYKVAVAFGIIFVFLLAWVQLAVGIFDTPLSGS